MNMLHASAANLPCVLVLNRAQLHKLCCIQYRGVAARASQKLADIMGKAHPGPVVLHNIVAWLLEQAPAGRSINASVVQLHSWREDTAIQAFLRSEELTTLNLHYRTRTEI